MPDRPRRPHSPLSHATMLLAVLVAWLAVLPARAAATAGAAGQWSRPVHLSALGGVAIYPQVAFDGRGNAVAVWEEMRGRGADSVVMASQRHLAGRWMRPVALSPAGQISLSPQIAASPTGAAVVVWGGSFSSSHPLPPFVQAAFRRSPGQPWSKPMRISRAGVEAEQPAVGIDDRGDANAVWITMGGGQNRIEVSALTMASGVWSLPVQLAEASQWLLVPQIAVSARGDAVAVWKRWISGSPFGAGVVETRIAGAVRPAGRRSWLAPVTLDAGFEPSGQGVAAFEFPGPHVAIDAKGDATVVWQGRHRRTIVAEAASRAAGGRWQTPAPISTRFAVYPHVAMDACGDATAVWQGPHGSVVAAGKAVTARRWSVRRLYRGNPGVAPHPQVSASPLGEAVATWSGNPVQAAVRPAGKAWRHPVRLGFGGVSQVALDPHGNAMVVWQRPVNHPRGIVIDAAGYTPSLPTARTIWRCRS